MTFRSILVASFLAASTFLAVDAAQAQVCGELDVAAPMSTAIYGYADDFLILDASTCQKVAKGGAAACRRFVTEVASCSVARSAAVFRVGGVACKGNGDAAYTAQSRAQLDQIPNAIQVVAMAQLALCDDLAEDALGDCLAGL